MYDAHPYFPLKIWAKKCALYMAKCGSTFLQNLEEPVHFFHLISSQHVILCAVRSVPAAPVQTGGKWWALCAWRVQPSGLK